MVLGKGKGLADRLCGTLKIFLMWVLGGTGQAYESE